MTYIPGGIGPPSRDTPGGVYERTPRGKKTKDVRQSNNTSIDRSKAPFGTDFDLTNEQIAWYRREIADGDFENLSTAWRFYVEKNRNKGGYLILDTFVQQIYGVKKGMDMLAAERRRAEQKRHAGGKPPEVPDAAAEDPYDLLGALEGGAADTLDDPLFLDFVAPQFMPSTDRVAYSHMDEWARTIIGRDLTPEERVVALKAWRRGEKKFYNSEVRKARAEHAREIFSKATAFGEGVVDLTGEEPTIGGTTGRPSETQAALAKKRMKDFTPFDEEDLELTIKQAIARLAPEEEFGLELRDAFEGLASAIRGHVSLGQFMP